MKKKQIKNWQIGLIILAIVLVVITIGIFSKDVLLGPSQDVEHTAEYWIDPATGCGQGIWEALEYCGNQCESQFCGLSKSNSVGLKGNSCESSDTNDECQASCWESYALYYQQHNCGPWSNDDDDIPGDSSFSDDIGNTGNL